MIILLMISSACFGFSLALSLDRWHGWVFTTVQADAIHYYKTVEGALT